MGGQFAERAGRARYLLDRFGLCAAIQRRVESGADMSFAALAAGAGLVWGVADFAGGKAAQRADALTVVWLSKLVSAPFLVACVVLAWTPPDVTGVWWGVCAGVFGTSGTVLFYRALSSGAMTLVAPVTSVTSAVVPVVVGLTGGERPSSLALAGVACAVLAIALVSLAPAQARPVRDHRRRLAGWAVGAGLGFALFMVCLAQAGRGTAGHSLWPVLSAHLTGLVLSGVVLVVVRAGDAGAGRPPRAWPPRRRLGWTGAAGILDPGATVSYLLAARAADLSLVAPIAALYPVTTVLLALVVERERPRPPQLAGLALSVAALQLVTRLPG